MFFSSRATFHAPVCSPALLDDHFMHTFCSLLTLSWWLCFLFWWEDGNNQKRTLIGSHGHLLPPTCFSVHSLASHLSLHRWPYLRTTHPLVYWIDLFLATQENYFSNSPYSYITMSPLSTESFSSAYEYRFISPRLEYSLWMLPLHAFFPSIFRRYSLLFCGIPLMVWWRLWTPLQNNVFKCLQ